MNSEDRRKYGHRIVDGIADYLSSAPVSASSGSPGTEALAEAIDRDVVAGLTPCAVVATTGTTTTTAVDPVAAIVGAASKRKLRVHIDAAMAGSAMILAECSQYQQWTPAMTVFVHAPGRAHTIASIPRAEVRALNPDGPLTPVSTLEE